MRFKAMMMIGCAALAGTVLAGSGASASPSISVKDAAEICRTGFPKPGGDSASMARRSTCVAYIDAVVATVAQVAALAATAKGGPVKAIFCIAPDVPFDALSETFLRYAEANDRYADRAAAALMVAAFAESYPCR